MKRRKKKRSQFLSRRKRPSPELMNALEKTDRLLDEERFDEIISLLEPFLEERPHAPALYIFLGMSYANVGAILDAIEQFQIAFSQQKDGDVIGTLGSLYAALGYHALALDAFRQAARLGVDFSKMPALADQMALFSAELRATAESLRKPVKKVAEGVRLLEKAQLAFERNDFEESIRLNQLARRYLGDFPVVDNNLSLAYFYHGEPERAIELARGVATRDPENIQAMGNLVRFLAWTGRKEEAGEVWERLRSIPPTDSRTRMKKAEAAAVIGDDEVVYLLLSDLELLADEPEMMLERAYFFHAVAEANTGRVEQARKDFEGLGEGVPGVKDYLNALKAGKPGLGLADRFPYFTLFDLVPFSSLNAFFGLLDMEAEMTPEEFRRQVDGYLRRFPQLLLVGEKLLLETGDPEMGIEFLGVLKTPGAYALLRDFALGQKGDERDRMKALHKLFLAGELKSDEPIRFWRDGEWRAVEVHMQNINPEREWEYEPPEVLEFLQQGMEAFRDGRLEEAETWFEKVLALNPDVREAYNNLGTVYAIQGRSEQAKEMFYKAIELDPLYVFPRSNLVWFLLDEGKIDEATEMILPVIDLPEYHPLEMVSVLTAQARIQIALGDLDFAEDLLERARAIDPDSDVALAVMKELRIERERAIQGEVYESWRKSARRYRERQRKLTSPDPTIDEALSIYTKDLLTAIARNVAPEGGWSKYRKAELLDFLAERLRDAGVQARLLASLPPEALEAFRAVQAQGGVMSWETFDRAFGNDLEDSPYWNYHEPQTIMGTLRSRALLVEAETDKGLSLVIPVELRQAKPR